MSKILIVYDSKEGQTRKIAEFIQQELYHNDWYADVITAGQKVLPNPVAFYSGIIVGGPVHISQYPKSLKIWVSHHRDALKQVPSAFFSVCLGILDKKNPKTIVAENDIMNRFLLDNDWEPTTKEIFAGALRYSKYNWLIKLIMKQIAKKEGGSTDVTTDHEYTDWQQVQGFVQRFLAQINEQSKKSSVYLPLL